MAHFLIEARRLMYVTMCGCAGDSATERHIHCEASTTSAVSVNT